MTTSERTLHLLDVEYLGCGWMCSAGDLALVLRRYRHSVGWHEGDHLIGAASHWVYVRIAFPVPGHTMGSVLWHVDDRLLFSGDSLSWDPRREQLHAFRGACWYSWEAQTASLGRFAESGLAFDRLFCGHGWGHDLDAAAFHDHLVDLVRRMATHA